MLRKSFLLLAVGLLAALATPSRTLAWGGFHAGYHYGAYGGGYHAGYTHVGYGGVEHYGTGGGYHYGGDSAYGDRYGGYHYGGYHYSYGGGFDRRW
jgi:hypothetical protein